MTDDAGQIFQSLIDEYKIKAKRSEQLRKDFPKHAGLGSFWLNSDTGILYVASLDEEGEVTWNCVKDVMGPKALGPLSTDGPDESWI